MNMRKTMFGPEAAPLNLRKMAPDILSTSAYKTLANAEDGARGLLADGEVPVDEHLAASRNQQDALYATLGYQPIPDDAPPTRKAASESQIVGWLTVALAFTVGLFFGVLIHALSLPMPTAP